MKKIKLTKGQFAIVDDDDFEEINKHKWCVIYSVITKSFYAVRTDCSLNPPKRVRMNRVILNVKDRRLVDHINHNTLDNRKCNLRICTNSQNGMNRRLSKNSKTGISGVAWVKFKKNWIAHIEVNKKHIHLGYFNNIFDAACSRKSAEINNFGEFAYKK